MGRSGVLESVRFHGLTVMGATSDSDTLTLVLIHGSMDRQAAFARVARKLGDEHRVISYDRRGYGKSVHQRGAFSMNEHIEDLREVIQFALVNKPIVLVGHSFGGTVALAFAQQFPDQVAGLVVYESPMSWETWWPKDSGGSAAVAIAHAPEEAAETFMRRFIGHRRWEALPEFTRQQRRSEGAALVGELGDIRRHKPWDLDQVRGPLIAGYGSRSKPHLQASAELLGQLPDCRSVMIEGAHHNAHSGSADDFVDLLARPLIKRVVQGDWS